MRALMIVLTLTCATLAHAQQLNSRHLPPGGKVLVFTDGDNGCPEYQQWKTIVKTEPSGFVTWSGDNWEWNDLDVERMDGFLCHCDTQAAALINLHLIKSQADRFIEGQFDRKIRSMGESIKASKRIVYIHLLAEHNEGGRHLLPANKYVAAFRHLRRIVESTGARPAFVFDASNGFYEMGRRVDWSYYPGDEYVDWFGVCVYHPGQIHIARITALLARQHRKALMVVESGPLLTEPRWRRDWSAFYGPYFRMLRECNVKAIQFWPGYPGKRLSVFDGGNLEALSPTVRNNLVHELQSSTYIKAAPVGSPVR